MATLGIYGWTVDIDIDIGDAVASLSRCDTFQHVGEAIDRGAVHAVAGA